MKRGEFDEFILIDSFELKPGIHNITVPIHKLSKRIFLLAEYNSDDPCKGFSVEINETDLIINKYPIEEK